MPSCCQVGQQADPVCFRCGCQFCTIKNCVTDNTGCIIAPQKPMPTIVFHTEQHVGECLSYSSRQGLPLTSAAGTYVSGQGGPPCGNSFLLVSRGFMRKPYRSVSIDLRCLRSTSFMHVTCAQRSSLNSTVFNCRDRARSHGFSQQHAPAQLGCGQRFEGTQAID